jgi:NAD(P)-dependent dehydrogenase (short-subunit alcohol dehydrogenase family)
VTVSEHVKSALITGGSSGLGFAVASRLIRGGFSVTIVGRREDALKSAASQLAGQGLGTVRTDVADVGTPDAPARIVANHVDAFGGITALVTAAASYQPIPFVDTTATTWDTAFNVGLRGTVLTAAAAARHMVAAGGGRIVLFSSINAITSEPESADYSAMKAAVTSLAKSMAIDLGSKGVITNAIAPGWCDTPMNQEFLATTTPEMLKKVNPMGRVGKPEEIADVAWFLIADAPSFLIGTTLYVDGGQTIAAPMP